MYQLFLISRICIKMDFVIQSICSLLHINKIFEVGISDTLREQLEHLNLDIIEKV